MRAAAGSGGRGFEARSGHQERRSQRGGDVIQLDVNRFKAGLGGLGGAGEAKAELERVPPRIHGAWTRALLRFPIQG